MVEANEPAESRKAKLGVSCQDYLWLTGQILESMNDDSVKQVMKECFLSLSFGCLSFSLRFQLMNCLLLVVYVSNEHARVLNC